MGPRAEDLALVATLLWRCPSLDLINFEIYRTAMSIAGSYIDLIEVKAHATSWDEAERFARALGLPEINEDQRYPDTNASGRAGFKTFRRWQGWMSGVSLNAPVSAEVFGANFVEDPEAAEAAELAQVGPSSVAEAV
jgi:hypothetical protein